MWIAWTTVASRADAERIASDCVARSLASCVQIDGPITAHYRWAGRIERTEEFRLTFKCLSAQIGPLQHYVLASHPYDTPEWLALSAERVGEKYLSWAEANSTFPPFHSSQPSP